jgi:tetratricopeptide (TPR) repeat protein
MKKVILASAMGIAVLATGCATAPAGNTGNAQPPAVKPSTSPPPAPTATAPSPASGPSATEQAQAQAELGKAIALVQQGKSAPAVSVLDGAILAFQSRYGDGKVRIYSTRSQAETLVYAKQAESEHRQALAAGPVWGELYYVKGVALVQLGQPAQARTAFERAIALSPANAQYWSELGNVYQIEKNWPKAFDSFVQAERVAEVSPPNLKVRDQTRALRGEGFALAAVGRLDDAALRYRRSLELDPGDKATQQALQLIAQRGSKPKPQTR